MTRLTAMTIIPGMIPCIYEKMEMNPVYYRPIGMTGDTYRDFIRKHLRKYKNKFDPANEWWHSLRRLSFYRMIRTGLTKEAIHKRL